MTEATADTARLARSARGQGLLDSLRRFSESRWRHVPFAILLIGGAAFLIAEALLNHRALGTGYDLGIYNQVVWNMAHGRLFATTLVYETNGYYDHFEPVLALIAPLYWLLPDVRVLLVLQSTALALGALPIYLYARNRLALFGPGFAMLALLLVVAYLLYPPLHSANLNDFHEVGLLPPLIGFALYGLLTGRRRLMFISLALCLLIKEDVTVTLLMFGLYVLLLNPAGFRRRDGLWMVAVAVVWGVLILNVLYPAMTHGMPYPFVERRYSWLGVSPGQALQSLVTQPGVALAHIFQPPKLVFLWRLFAPLLFLPLLGWPVIGLALPILAYLMMSDYRPQWSVESYYNPPLLAFLFFATIVAVMWLTRHASGLLVQRRWGEGERRAPRTTYRIRDAETRPADNVRDLRHEGSPERTVVATLLIAITISVGCTYYAVAPGPGSRLFRWNKFAVSARVEAARSIMAQVPPAASLSTEWPLIPHLSQRLRVYTLLERPAEPPQYLLTEWSAGAEHAPGYPYAAPPGWPPIYHEYRPVATAGPFQLSERQRSVTLTPAAKPERTPKPISLAAYAWLDSPLTSEAPVLKPGDRTRLMLGWQQTGRLRRRYVMFIHILPDCGPTAANGLPHILAQSGHEPGDGQSPTTLWETWTVPPIVLDEQILEIPADAPAGTYCVWAGVSDKETGQRLELGGPGRTLALVGPLTVAP